LTAQAALASLPMHDHAAVRWATDALWARLAEALRARGIPAPDTLDRRPAYAEVWGEPGLVLAQTCGYPFATRLRGKVRLVATPCYRAAGCEGARYRSLILVRADDPAGSLSALRGRGVAYNDVHSQSGYNALRAAVAPHARDGRFFGTAVATGSHRASLRAVADGRADACAVDCVTWALLARHEPGFAVGFRAIGETPAAPGLPLVTAAATDDATLSRLRAAVLEAFAAPATAAARDVLLIEGAEALDAAAYGEILDMERAAAARGYPALA
jgi:ABC-type phosphate/phosphonate transport system substrate-binding protein